MTRLPEVPDDDTALQNYEAEQKQRKLENKIRQAKRKAAGAVNEANQHEATKDVRRLQKELREHLKNNPKLKRHSHREKIYNKNSALLNQKEVAAIKKYIGPDSYRLNDAMRNDHNLTPEEKDWVKNINSALEKLPIYQGTVTRSLDFVHAESLQEYAESHIIGQVVNYKQFISSTKGEVYNESANVQLEILSKRGVDISFYNPKEQEVLFNTYSNFLVVDKIMENGVLYIKLEEK